jgi:hypothetical protein
MTRQELPQRADTLEALAPTSREDDSGPGDEVSHSARYENLSRPRLG